MDGPVDDEAEVKFYFAMEKIFCVLLSALCICGAVANIFVLKCVIRDAFRNPCTTIGVSRRRRRDPKAPPLHVYVYIGALLISDLLLLINCPFIVHDIANNGWYFGRFLCKFVSGNESFHKVMTGFLLAALSFDQLITVRKIVSSKWRTVSRALAAIGCFAVVDIVLQMPLFVYTDVIVIPPDKFEAYYDLNGTNISSISFLLNMTYFPLDTEKCLCNPPPSMELLVKAFTICIFAVGFCVPTLIILVSYGTVINRMVSSGYFKAVGIRHRMNNTNDPMRKGSSNGCRLITWYVSLLVAIYICCWAPYWTLTALQAGLIGTAPAQSPADDDEMTSLEAGLIGNGTALSVGEEEGMTYVLLYLHLLPYLNATLNPFAYGYLVQCCVFKCSRSNGDRRSPNCLMAFFRRRGLFGRDSMATECSRGWSLEETWGKPTTTPRNRNGTPRHLAREEEQ